MLILISTKFDRRKSTKIRIPKINEAAKKTKTQAQTLRIKNEKKNPI
jgi:hypothetical protein